MTTTDLNLNTGTYIDLFSGCGGLSLGLGKAGWKGLFAIEKDSMAFETFKYNMLGNGKYQHFDWPSWLPQQANTIQSILEKYPEELSALKGKVDLIAGGPPCQGFSMAGMRNPNDPRNQLSEQYIKMVELIEPKFIVLENVRGFNSVFKGASCSKSKIPHSQIVRERLESLGYSVFQKVLNAEQFGVPQKRTRFIMIGIKNSNIEDSPFELLDSIRSTFLKSKGLPNRSITVQEAISDLEVYKDNTSLIYHSGSSKNPFYKIDYQAPEKLSPYQKVIRKGLRKGSKPNSLRLARHKDSTIEKFKTIHSISRPGVVLSQSEKAIIGTKKQAICVLDPKKPSKTLTTLPDDILHYSEPRILTVRESARIQSFPDDFKFVGKYTTGGKSRTKECPRYTQVGNAVPPLLGEAIGTLIHKILSMEHLNDTISKSAQISNQIPQ